MSTEKVVEGLAKRIDRRRALVKVGTGIVGGLAALMGLPRGTSAHWYHYRCCHLCQAPTSCSCPAEGCVWCWSCLWGDGWYWKCCECHYNQTYCGSDCLNILCSFSYRYAQSPEP